MKKKKKQILYSTYYHTMYILAKFRVIKPEINVPEFPKTSIK